MPLMCCFLALVQEQDQHTQDRVVCSTKSAEPYYTKAWTHIISTPHSFLGTCLVKSLFERLWRQWNWKRSCNKCLINAIKDRSTRCYQRTGGLTEERWLDCLLKISRVSTSRKREGPSPPRWKQQTASLLKGNVCFTVCKGIEPMKRHPRGMRWIKTMEDLEYRSKENGLTLCSFLRQDIRHSLGARHYDR